MTTKTRRVQRTVSADNVIVSEDELRQRRPISVYRAAKLVTSLGEFLCVIKSISSRTVVAETHVRLTPGERLRIELGHDLVAATTTSAEGGTIALLFDDSIDVQSWLGADGAQHRRTAPRIAIDVRARVQIGNQLLFVKARNISQEGMGIETQDILMEGDELMIALRGWQGPIAGSIVRVDGDFAGIRFLQPIGFRALSEWLGQSGCVRPPVGTGDAFERLAP
jgi:hypothetical protein